MGLFSKDEKLEFEAIPSAPEQTQARSFLVDLMEKDWQFPVEGTAELTDTEKQIQSQLPSYLSDANADYQTARTYYNDVLSGNYDPRTSDFYQGFRTETDMAKQDAQLDVARSAQMGGMARSTPAAGIQARVGQQYDAQNQRVLGELYENERNRMGAAAGALPGLSTQRINNAGAVEDLAMVARQREQQKLSAMFQAALQTMLAPYNMSAKIAQVLLGEQR
jgi:hypothetical protein